MSKEEYVNFRKIFLDFSGFDFIDVINEHTPNAAKKRQAMLKEILAYEKAHGNPTKQLRKNQKDYSIYVQLTYD